MTQEQMQDHARGCQGREYTCTCGYDNHLTNRLSEVERERDEADREADRLGNVNLDLLTQLAAAQAEVARVTKERDEAVGTLRWAHDTLYEINPSNYNHDEVTKLNDASVEVILGIAPLLGETHGKTDAWWHSRIEGQRAQLTACQAESAACWKNLVEAGRQRDQARADLATLRAAIAEAVRRGEHLKDELPAVAYRAEWITEPLRNLDQPEGEGKAAWWTHVPAPDPEQPDDPSLPEGEDALVDDGAVDAMLSAIDSAGRGYSIRLTRLVDNVSTYTLTYRDEQHEFDSNEDAHEALAEWKERERREAVKAFLASRGLVRGEGV